MLKALAETGALSREQLTRVFASLPELTEPDAILHVLQMVRFDPVAARGVRDAMVPLAGSSPTAGQCLDVRCLLPVRIRTRRRC
jgi:hypothetical protein